MRVDAIIPAHDEEATVEGVVRVVLGSRHFRRVLVVDDGSADRTAARAKAAGAEVFSLAPNRGKAEAMLAGVEDCCGKSAGVDAFAFFDADLTNLRPEHVDLLAQHFRMGFDQVCGLRDYGLLNFLHAVTPVMTGERIVRRWVLERVPETCWKGYAIETVINGVVDRGGGKTCLVPLRDLRFRNKTEKVGPVQGWIGHARMARQMDDAARSFAESGGVACAIRGKS